MFLPLGFVGGLVSQFFLPFALTVTFALLASLICALTVVPVLAYFLIDKVNVDVDEDGEPSGSLLGPRSTRRSSRASCAPAGRPSASSPVAASCSSPRWPSCRHCRPSSSTPARRRSSRSASRRRPARRSEAVLERAIEAEAILVADPDVELIQTSIPGEGDTSFQTIIAAQSGRPANSATMTVRLDPTADLAEKTAEFSAALEPVKTDGYDVQVSEAAGFTSNGLNVIVSAEDRGRSSTDDRGRRRRARRTTPTWPTSRATWSRPRPRSRSPSTRPRRSPSA